MKENPTCVKIKPNAKITHLINWYWGNFCVKHEESTREHYEELRKIALSWNIPEMTHKDFCIRIRKNLACNPHKRRIEDCPLCRKIGIPQWRF